MLETIIFCRNLRKGPRQKLDPRDYIVYLRVHTMDFPLIKRVNPHSLNVIYKF